LSSNLNHFGSTLCFVNTWSVISWLILYDKCVALFHCTLDVYIPPTVREILTKASMGDKDEPAMVDKDRAAIGK